MRAAYGRVLRVLKTKMTSTAEAATTATESSISVANRCSGVSSTPPQTVTCSLEQQFTEKMSVQHTSDAQRQRRPRELVSVAPMMEYTDHHFRQFMRLLTKKTKLYTEMVVDHIIIHSPDVEPILQFDPIQKPIALQIGGSNPDTLAEACQKVIPYGYEEVNLNCGCPSDRVATVSHCFLFFPCSCFKYVQWLGPAEVLFWSQVNEGPTASEGMYGGNEESTRPTWYRSYRKM